jgi:hypothetical protein
MSTKLTDPGDFLFEMEEPIRAIRGANDTLMSIGTSDTTTKASINFIADAIEPEIKRLENLWQQWAKTKRTPTEKEG